MIRLHLRGERASKDVIDLGFKHKFTGGDAIRVHLHNRARNIKISMPVTDLMKNNWAETIVCFRLTDTSHKDVLLDEIEFELPKGAELLLDDVLLSVPGK